MCVRCFAGASINRRTWAWNAAAAVFAYGYGTLAERGYKAVGHDQLVAGTWPDNVPGVSCMDWQTGMVNAKYWVTQLLAATVGDAKPKTIVASTVHAPQGAPDGDGDGDGDAAQVYVMAFVKDGRKGALLVNKQASPHDLVLHGARGGAALVVEVTGEEPGFNPPVARQVSANGSIALGPFGVAVVVDLLV